MLEYVGIGINEVGAIFLFIAAAVPSSQEVLEIDRGLECGFLCSKSATRDIEDDYKRSFEVRCRLRI
jgi:hypothetical protein